VCFVSFFATPSRALQPEEKLLTAKGAKEGRKVRKEQPVQCDKIAQ
jgi:hypothetical protein